MKKILSTLIAVVLLALTVVPALASVNPRGINPGQTLYVETSGGSVSVRETPSPKGKVLYKLNYGTAVTAGSAMQDNYLFVNVKGKSSGGYVDMRYLSVNKPGKSAKEKETVASLSFKSFKLVPEGTTMVVVSNPGRAGGLVNFRWVPSTNGAIIDRLFADEQLYVISQGKDWYQVRNKEGYVGFVAINYTSIVYNGPSDGWQETAEAQAE